MPNHCENDLWITGDDADVAEVLAFIGADQTPPVFRFEAVIPYPEPWASMDAEHHAIEDAGKAAGEAAIGAWPERDDPEFDAKRQAYIAASNAAQRPLMDAYEAKWKTRSDGYNSGGYQWCCAAWGTKWGAYDVLRRDYDRRVCVTYQTAWGPSRSIIVALAERFPRVTFTLEYFERGMAFCGGFTCPSKDDMWDDEPWKPGIVVREWEHKDYRGQRGG